MNMRKFFLGVLVLCLGSIVFFISRCNMIDKSSYYVLECRTGNTGNDNEKKIYAASIILMANAPCLKSSLKKNLETFFWENITLDTINNVSSTNSKQSKLCINSPLHIDARLLWKQAISSNSP